ncbi:hypothetical protein D3C79_1054440 [compost metagenome]
MYAINNDTVQNLAHTSGVPFRTNTILDFDHMQVQPIDIEQRTNAMKYGMEHGYMQRFSDCPTFSIRIACNRI